MKRFVVRSVKLEIVWFRIKRQKALALEKNFLSVLKVPRNRQDRPQIQSVMLGAFAEPLSSEAAELSVGQ